MRYYFILLVYAGFIAIGLYHHEMWRDELQAWNIVLKSESISDLVFNIRYEGHPVLWFLILWPFSKFTNSPYSIQIINFCLSVLTAYLVIFKSPLSKLEKVAILFSYFLFFEYGLISRNYNIGIFLLLCSANFWKNYKKNILIISILIFLLFQCNAFISLIAIALVINLLIKLYLDKVRFSYRFTAASILVITGGILFLITTMPKADSSYAAIWNLHFWPGLFIGVLAKMNTGLVPIPLFITSFWETRIIKSDIINAIIGIAIWFGFLWIWRKNTISFVFVLTSFVLILSFLYLKPFGGMRHYGHFSVVLIFAYWVNHYDKFQPQISKLIFRSIFLVQAVIGLFAAFQDWNHPFSNAKNVAAFIRQKLPDDVQIAGAYNNLSTSVAGYLGTDIYFLNDGRYSNHVIWREKYWNEKIRNLDEREIFIRYISTVNVLESNVLVLNYTGNYATNKSMVREGESKLVNLGNIFYKVTCIKMFSNAIASEENYVLYSLSISK